MSIGGVALSWLLKQEGLLAAPIKPELEKKTFDLIPKMPHHEPKAKAMIYMFMQGGPSHIDLFERKPELEKRAGEAYPGKLKFDSPEQVVNKLYPSPWKWQKFGECGTEISTLLPHLGSIVDDVCLVRSMRTAVNNHGQSTVALNTGRTLAGRPVLGSWLSYGLGSESQDLPAYMVLVDPGGHPVDGVTNWSNGFMPPLFQGTVVRSAEPRILNLDPPPHRHSIPLHNSMSRIGTPWVACDPKKIIGIVETNELDDVSPFTDPDAASDRIAQHTVEFLIHEYRAGRIPKEFLPMQAGVGNIANAVMIGLGRSADIPPFTMYTEVFQDGLVGLMESGKLTGASTTALTLSPGKMQHVFDNIDFFAPKIVLRPQEISNNPGIVRRLGVITMNTALEIDIYGHINSTHVAGTQMMNGIGGSGDFTRNAYLSIYMAPSIAKGGRISTIVPMASHVDHNEHSVQIVVTEQGIADLRGLGPAERAKALIENCAHPMYRDYLRQYLAESKPGHLRHDLAKCFELHRNLLDFGRMLPDG